MPAKNIVKTYVENGFYHIYNRGVEKRKIFLDERDYKVLLYFLKQYLSKRVGPSKGPKNRDKSLAEEIDLLSYCLMPNHFHLLVKQRTHDGITKLMRCLCTNYVMYFNKRYERVGTLFQGRYKAVLIEEEPYLLHLTRYIHLNPLELPEGSDPKRRLSKYPYSSYAEYLGKRNTEWIKPKEILSFFKTAQRTSLKDILSYQSFVEDYLGDPTEILGPLAID